MLTHPIFIGNHGTLLLAMTTGSASQSSDTMTEHVELSNSSTSASNGSHFQNSEFLTRYTSKNPADAGKAPAALHRASALVPPSNGVL